MAANVPYIATVTDCQEVTLVGTADLAWWREQLAKEGLHPAVRDGQAEIVLTAVASKWFIRFREFNIALFVSRQPDGGTRDGLFLASAFNTSRTFTFCERTMFHTPYQHAAVTVATAPPQFQLAADSTAAIQAVRHATTAARATTADGWEGSLALPTAPGRVREQFFARLGGETAIHPFAAGVDEFAVNPSRRMPATQWLLDSQFTPLEWHLRLRAVHARSRTYPRT